MKKIILILFGLVVLAVIAVVILRGNRTKEYEVEMAEVARKDLVATVTSSGTIHPKRSVEISSEVMGKVIRLAVEEGDTVREGDFLLRFDDTALAAAVRTARADLNLSEASAEKADLDLRRARELFEMELKPAEHLDAARTESRVAAARVEAAQSRLDRALDDLAKTEVTAPMSGVVTRLNVEEGESAIMGALNVPGTVLLEIADLSVMEARVKVDETEVVKLALKQSAEIEIDAFADTVFTGQVSEIGNSPIYTSSGASQQAVDFEVKITLLDRVPHIRPGLSCKAEIKVAAHDSALAVPLGAVIVRKWPPEEPLSRRRGRRSRAARQPDTETAAPGDTSGTPAAAEVDREEKEGVFVVQDGLAHFRAVVIGIAGEDDFEVVSGLTAGEKVVTGPFRILRDLKHGDAVKEENAK